MATTDTDKIISSLHDAPRVKLLFVCLGNICRSPAAEGVMKAVVEEHGEADRFVIDSAGTGNYHTGDLPDHRMRIHAHRRGYDLTHHARQVTPEDFEKFDLIIGMDNSNIDRLRAIAPTADDVNKIVPMARFISKAMRYDYVPDPYYEGAEGFELVLDLLQDGCENLYQQLKLK